MAINLAACITSFLVAFIILPVLIKYSFRKNLVDEPGHRKVHTKITPSLGGIAIFTGFLVATMIWMDFSQWHIFRYVLSSLFIIFLLGVRDDLVTYHASQKLVGQMMAIVVLLFSPLEITSFYGFMGINELPAWFAYAVTAFTIIVIINSFNLIDGLDGLAGSIGIVSLTAFGIWFYAVGDYMFALVCFSMIGAIAAFLIYNWEPSEIFMGDTGALVIGTLLAILVIHFMHTDFELAATNPLRYTAIVSTAAAFIIIPLSDTMRIMILRVSKGLSPFRPDQNHIHHRIARLGVSHAATSIILASVNGAFVVFAWFLRDYDERIVFPAVIIPAIVVSFLPDIAMKVKLAKKEEGARREQA